MIISELSSVPEHLSDADDAINNWDKVKKWILIIFPSKS